MQNKQQEISKTLKSTNSILSKQQKLYLQAADKPWMVQFLLLPLWTKTNQELNKKSFSGITKNIKTHTKDYQFNERFVKDNKFDSTEKNEFYLLGNLPFSIPTKSDKLKRNFHVQIGESFLDSKISTQDAFLSTMRKTIFNSSIIETPTNQNNSNVSMFYNLPSQDKSQMQQKLLNSADKLSNKDFSGNTKKNQSNFLSYWLLPFLSLLPLTTQNSSILQSSNWVLHQNLSHRNSSQSELKNKQNKMIDIMSMNDSKINTQKPETLVNNYLQQTYFINSDKIHKNSNHLINPQAQTSIQMDPKLQKRFLKTMSIWLFQGSNDLNLSNNLTDIYSDGPKISTNKNEFALKTSKPMLKISQNNQTVDSSSASKTQFETFNKILVTDKVHYFDTDMEPTRFLKEFQLGLQNVNKLTNIDMIKDSNIKRIPSLYSISTLNNKLNTVISGKNNNQLQIAFNRSSFEEQKSNRNQNMSQNSGLTDLKYSYLRKLLLNKFKLASNTDFMDYSSVLYSNKLKSFSMDFKSQIGIKSKDKKNTIFGATKILTLKQDFSTKRSKNTTTDYQQLNQNILNYTPLRGSVEKTVFNSQNTNTNSLASDNFFTKNSFFNSLRLIQTQQYQSPSHYIKYIKSNLELATNYWVDSFDFKTRAISTNIANLSPNKTQNANPDAKFMENTKQFNTSVVLNHKKFAYAPLKISAKKMNQETDLNQTLSGIKRQNELNLQMGQTTLTNQSELKYLERKKDIQKKRKAKKLRLESRRQKKRKRFYPRPIWLRLRLALSKIASKKITNANEKIINRSEFGKNLSKSLLTTGKSLVNFTQNTTIGQMTSNTLETNSIISRFYSKAIATGSKRMKFLVKVKNNANYSNFEVKSANNTLPKKERKNSSLLAQSIKDFWIWLYNMSNTHFACKQSLIFSQMSTGLVQNSDIKIVSEQLLKTKMNEKGKYDFTFNSSEKNQIAEFWAMQKSMNPLSISKTVSIGSESALTKTETKKFKGPKKIKNYKYGHTYVPREKTLQMISWAFNKTNLSTINNKRLSIWGTQKLRNQSKNNKTKFLEKKFKKYIDLAFSPSVSNIWFNSSTSYNFNEFTNLSQDILKPTNTVSVSLDSQLKKRINKKVHQKEQKLMYLSNRSFLTLPFMDSNTALNTKHLETFSLRTKDAYQPGSNNLVWWSNLPFMDFSQNNLDKITSGNNAVNGASFDKQQTVTTFGLLLHFCALVSLLSISQVRCFVKFHLILIHKLSNLYIDILLSTALKVHSNISNFLKVSTNSNLFRATRFSSEDAWFGTYWNNSEQSNKIQNHKSSSSFKLKTKKLSGLVNETKSSFTLAMLQKTSAESNKNKRMVYYKTNNNVKNSLGIASQMNLTEENQRTKSEIIKQLTRLIQENTTNTNRFSEDNSKNQKITSIKQKWLNLYLIMKQLEATQFYQFVLTGIKKQTVNTSFQIVDTFESWLKFIYSFFEKPAEFTMDWIAYAFLVEWSSDLLAFTPHTNERTNWLALSKYTRQSTIGLALYSTTMANTSSNILVNTSEMSAFNNLVTLANSSKTWTMPISTIYSLAFSQFLTKRFLYLNDLLLTIIYRPDTDLMSRQKKGKLFWDIWSDLLIKAADKYNINIPSLANIKEEQNVLLDNFLSTSEKDSKQDKNRLTFENNKNKSGVKSSTSFLFNKSEKLIVNILKQYSASTPNQSNHFYFQTDFKHKTDLSLDQLQLQTSKNVDNNFESDFHSLGGTTYQSKETDLFIHQGTPTSLNYLSAIKYYTVVQQPIGNLVCEIFAGLLNKQIAKNVLVIGSTLGSNIGGQNGIESLQKTLLIQALAGETEMKIITDNASRYAVVNRGFAVGIKYLKEVFEAITLNTPCLFLLEDIHLIGERRPLLISDHGDSIGSSGASDLSKSAEATFGSQRNGDAVHEKNQIYYQLSRHGITHYKKPFKGDFSLAIPSNHFAFDLYLKPRHKNLNTTTSTGSTAHPFASQINIFGRNQSLSGNQNENSNTNNGTNSQGNMSESTSKSQNKQINSRVKPNAGSGFDPNTGRQLGTQSGSPFSVLLLKEQKKLKANKIVNELPWVGLPTEQLAILPRVSYSVRAKVSALAELGFSNMSAKLDMITDLLVIIDSVRGHRGFVVFATTHLPHILDPALRRPGRLDETISIPILSNLWTRWEFSKHTMSFSSNEANYDNFTLSFDKIANSFDSHNKYCQKYLKNNSSLTGTLDYFSLLNLNISTKQQVIIKTSIFSPILTGFKKLEQLENIGFNNLVFSQKQNNKNSLTVSQSTSSLKSLTNTNFTKLYTSVAHIAYHQMGKKLITTQFAFNLSHTTPIYLNPALQYKNSILSQKLALHNQAILATTETTEVALLYGAESLKYKSLFSSSSNFKNVVISLMAGKFSEYFAFTNTTISKTKEFSCLEKVQFNASLALATPKAMNFSTKIKPSIQFLNGINQTWRAATTFVLSVLQKRYLFNKNLIVPKLLNFLDYTSLEEPPSPPSSNILIPAKRYENSKKSFKQSIQKNLYGLGTSTINDKLQTHKKQSYIKSIYAKNDSNFTNTNHLESLTANLLNVTANDINKNLLLQPTNATQIYQIHLLKRHRMSLNNQWWNGQLTEHTAESLFLSDIDWRYTFIPDTNLSNSQYGKQNTMSLNFKGLSSIAHSTKETIQTNLDKNPPSKENNQPNTKSFSKDIVIDFPDADQIYNPKHRRWFVTTGYWASWFNVDKQLQAEFVNHLILESVINTYSFLNNNREFLDFSVAKFLKKGYKN